MSGPPECQAQTYWYDNGVQRAKFCDELASVEVACMDGSSMWVCEDDADKMIEAGAKKIHDLPCLMCHEPNCRGGCID